MIVRSVLACSDRARRRPDRRSLPRHRVRPTTRTCSPPTRCSVSPASTRRARRWSPRRPHRHRRRRGRRRSKRWASTTPPRRLADDALVAVDPTRTAVTRGVVGDRRRAGVRRVRRRRHAGHSMSSAPPPRLVASSGRGRRAEHDPRRQRALPRRSAHAARGRSPTTFSGVGPARASTKRSCCTRWSRSCTCNCSARTPELAAPVPSSQRQNSLAITLLNSRHPGAPTSRCARPTARHDPGWGAGHADARLLEHPVRERPPVAADAPRSSATCIERVAGATPPSPSATTTTSADWWSAHGARGALDRGAQWRAAVALGSAG